MNFIPCYYTLNYKDIVIDIIILCHECKYTSIVTQDIIKNITYKNKLFKQNHIRHDKVIVISPEIVHIIQLN